MPNLFILKKLTLSNMKNGNLMEKKNRDRVRVTKEFVFDMGHALIGYDGPCKDIHGHTYHLSVTIIGTPLEQPGAAKDGMVVDFGLIKGVVHDKIISHFDQIGRASCRERV